MRWKVTCAYDGTDYCGWQIQPNGVSVQEILEKRLEIIFKEPLRIHGSGRTDSGVHAEGQVFHFDADWNHPSVALENALQCSLPESILIKDVVNVSEQFHARFSALAKRYVYRFQIGHSMPKDARYVWSIPGNRAIDFELMQSALNRFVGWHDFSSFSANRGEEYENTWRCITEALVIRTNRVCRIQFEGNGFMYKMVRGLAGAVIAVAQHKISIEEFEGLLNGENRGSLVTTAPAKGLSLEKVYYRNKTFPPPPPDVEIPKGYRSD